MSYYYPDLHQQQYGTPNPPSMQQNINTNPYPQQQYYSQQPYYPYNSSQQMPFNGPPHTHYPNPSVVDPNALFQFVPPKPKSNHTEVQDITLPIRPNWKPSVEDKQLIEEWFDCISAVQSQADIAKHVGGMEVAVFLKKSNLPKDVLRSIWSLVDKENLGRVNLEQFTIIIRLVSIHCSPIFAGSVPSLDRYYDTVEDVNVRLPFALCEAVAAEQKSKKVDIALPPYLATESSALAPEPMLTSPAFQPVLPTYPYPSSASTISNQPDEYPASATEDEEFSDFTGATTEVPPAIVQPTVQPSPMPDMLDMDDLSFSVPATKTIELPSYYSGGIFDILDPIRDDEEDFQSFVAAEPTETTTPAPPQGSISSILAEELDEFDNFVSHQAPKESLSVESLERLSERSSLEPTVWLGYHSHSGTSLPSLAEGTASQHSEAVDTLKSDFSGGVMALPTTLNNKMSAFDDLVIAEQEEWDEFAGAAEEVDTGKSNFETFSAPEASSAGPVVRMEEEEDNSLLLLDFESDFIVQPASIPALPNSSSTDTNLFLGMDWFEPIVDTVNKDAKPSNNTISQPDNDDDFEDFVDCTQANVSTNPRDNSSTICAQTSTLQSRNDEPNNITKEDLDFSSALKVEEKIETTEQVSEIFSDDDDFGDFEMHEDNFSEPNGHPIKEAQVPSAVPHLLPTVGAPVSAKSLSDFSPPAAVKSTSIPEKKFSVAPIEVDRQLSSEVINSFSPGTQKLLGRFKQPKNTSTTMNINSSVEASASSNISPLSMSELEQLSQSLADMNMYEEAYACARQVYLLRRISGLIEQKRKALDSNDSDLAQKIKVDASQLAKKLEPQSQEAVWIQLSKEQRKETPIEDLQDLLEAIDADAANLFSAKYMAEKKKQMSTNEAVYPRMQLLVSAKRSARMIIATRTTHDSLGTQWLAMLKKIYVKLMDGQFTLTKFKGLTAADQSAVRAQKKMDDYLKGLVSICEVACWLSTSCTEAMVHIPPATDTFNMSQKLLTALQKTFGISCAMMDVSMEEMILEAGRLSERADVTYCDLLLRPLFQGNDEVRVVEYYPHNWKNGSQYFMQAAAKFYVAEVDKVLPICEAAFG